MNWRIIASSGDEGAGNNWININTKKYGLISDKIYGIIKIKYILNLVRIPDTGDVYYVKYLCGYVANMNDMS